MCTAIRFNERLFGRTFDYERSYGEELVITPRGRMRVGQAENRYAIMGIGIKNEHAPLYFDGVNEWGLTAAALNFPGYAVYHEPLNKKAGVSASHLISLMLGFCRSAVEVRDMLKNISITADAPGGEHRVTPLHWIVADERQCLVVESVSGGLRVYENPVGVLTNSPELPYHLTRLADYRHLSPKNPKNLPLSEDNSANENLSSKNGSSQPLSTKNGANQPLSSENRSNEHLATESSAKEHLSTEDLQNQSLPPPTFYSRGMGAIGLPGDYSSSSRFVRAAYLKEHAPFPDSKDGVSDISHAFDILASLSLPCGAVITDEGQPMSTRYTAVIDMESPGYYLTSATCRAIGHIRLTDSLCEGGKISSAPIYKEQIICDL